MNPSDLSPATARRIDQTCDRFEAAWKAGRRPDPAEYLGGADGGERSALLRQLLFLDWEYRRRAGETPRAADYDTRFPDDPAVVADVDRELAAASAGDPSPAADGPDFPAAVVVDALAARYDLGPEVGRGGIGVVYRCRDRYLGRDVAVKLLRDDYRNRPDARRRFAAEARVGSRLQHPAIVPVYEFGRSADLGPFLAMKLVEGHTLVALLGGRPSPGHDLPRFLGVFEQVCQAVAYAHARGVVHRDLKPHNVMVGGFGEVQVMDWGFAGLRDEESGRVNDGRRPGPIVAGLDSSSLVQHSSSTQTGTVLGTPAYMPPEQARGEAGATEPQADVFALGAILCEILTGRPPYTGDTVDEVCRRAAAGELADAAARLDGCGADPALRELARRCLAADRAARPADAAAVAGAVTAYLASAQERLRRAEVDRAAAVARAAGERRARRLMLALATALLAGAGAAAWQAVVADKARQTAETAADAESTAKKDALDAAAREAAAKKDALDAAAREAAAKKDALAAAAAAAAARKTAETKGAETRAILGFVDDHILSAARPKGLRGGLGPNVTLRAAIEAAVPFVGTGFKDQPLTEARLRKILGDSFQMMGDGKAAAAQYEPARAAYERLLGPNDLVTLAITNDLGISYNMGGRWRDSVALYEQILPRCQAKFGPGSDLTLACQSNLAAGYIRLGQVDRAAPIMKDVLDATRARYGPGDRNTLQSVGNLAGVYATQRRYDEALALGLEGLEAAKTALGPDDFDTLIAAHNLAIIYRGFGQYAEALRHDQDTLRRRINTLTHGHPETVNSLCAVAEDLFYFGRGAEAVPLLDESLRQNKGRFVSRSFPMVATQRLKIFEAARDAAGCRATAELWEGQGRADDASLYAAAKCRAVTAAVLRATAPSPAAAAAADADARRGLVWLIRARVAGAPAAEIRDERGFDALRADAEFQRLAFE